MVVAAATRPLVRGIILGPVRKTKATVSASGRAVERLPMLARDAIRRGHEVEAHGWRWESHDGLDQAAE